MARANIHTDYAEMATEAGAGEWQALRGELVALLDKVESRYGAGEPAVSGVSRRVQHLRSQVDTPEPAIRHREALRSVKRAVDRFSDRDHLHDDEVQDDLTLAISEIRSRQGSPVRPRRGQDMAELQDLGALVGGMSHRLERLEGELKTQRSGTGEVREIAGQVEQLTHVVELLAGAVGETGQVKRLETQMAVLAAMIEEGPKVDLDAVNRRLDDVSATVAKLADLQAQQMEREIARDERGEADARISPAAELQPAMHAIEASVRNVYDRIDAIEKNVALSSGDFERLTGELAAFTKAMKSQASQPSMLVQQVEALADRIEGLDSPDADVKALRGDIVALRDAVLGSMEPRFLKIESRIEALSERVVPADTRRIEDQLKTLMQRMDEAGSQLDGLARLYASEDRPDMESLAVLVAERTSDAMARKAPAPVAMFGPESLKSIEDRIGELIRSAKKGPDYETLADMVATRASEAIARNAPAGAGASQDSIVALEERVASLLNSAGKDTADRLARLEAALAGRTQDALAAKREIAPEPQHSAPARQALAEPAPQAQSASRLDSILASLGAGRDDAMPANPTEDMPLIDKGFREDAPVRAQATPKIASLPKAAPARAAAAAAGPAPAQAQPAFDPAQVERPPRPQSSFAAAEADPFADAPTFRAPAVEPAAAASSTSTFVAAARRAQRARQEEAAVAETGNSLIGKALARVRTRKAEPASEPAPQPAPAPAPQPVLVEEEKAEAPAPKPRRKLREPKVKPVMAEAADASQGEAGFLTRHRRPLLLAATLVAVSMLALNLVLQRSAQTVAPAPVAANTSVDDTVANPAPSDDESAVVPPRIIEMIDPTATGSINPGEPMSFSKAATGSQALAATMPAALMAAPTRIDLADEAAPVAPSDPAPDVTGSIGQAPASVVEPFELPPDAVGPLELRQAAANGDARAQFEVGAIYTEGQAVTQDFAEAAKWYERGAAQGFAPAQYRLANLYEVGTGVEKDLEEARLWYQRAAEAGNRMAMHNLAALYAGGQLGEQQFELAAEWFERAATLGMTDSQFNLGMLYARGLGVEQDFEQSYKWFSVAARSGDKDATQARDDIAKSLSAEAVGRINSDLSAWKPEAIALAANFAPIGTWAEKFDPGQTITNRDVISKVQQALSRLGFDIGTADGVAGPKTAEAIKAFENGVGMSETGKINPRFLAVLGSQPA